MNRALRIHLSQIPEGGSLHVEDEIDPACLNLEHTPWVSVSPVRCSVDVSTSNNGLLALGTASIDLQAPCVKCLQVFDAKLQVANLALHQELGGSEVVDLTDELREDILLILPSHPRCDVDGSRECPATFRSAPDLPLAQSSDVASDAWNALDRFKPKK